MTTDAVLRAALAVSDRIAAGDPLWADDLVERLDSAVGTDTVGFASDLQCGFIGHSVNTGGPPLSDEERIMWAGHWNEYPFFGDLLSGGPGAAVRSSDRIRSMADFRRTTVYGEHFEPRGARYQANFGLVSDGRIAVVGLYRRHRDFSGEEVEALELARRLLVRTLAYRACVDVIEGLAAADGGLLDANALTPRQQSVLSLVAAGATDRSIAKRLQISERTVRKHLADARERLHARSRTDAARWWLTRARRGTGHSSMES